MRSIRFELVRPARGALQVAAAAALLAACKDSPSASTLRECEGEPRRLAVGEAVEVRPGATCDLGRRAGAEYALAFLDARTIEAARTAAEPYHSTNTYAVTVEDLLAGAGGAVLPSLALPAPADGPEAEVDWAVAPAGGPGQYQGASGGDDGWSVGEAVTIGNDCQAGPCPTRSARVMRVYDGWLAVAAVEGEVQAQLPAMLALLDQAVPVVAQHALPLLRSAFTDGALVESAVGRGQVFVLLEGDHSSFLGRAFARPGPGGEPLTFISLEPFDRLDVIRTVSILAHELAHAYQFAFMMGSRGQGVPAAGLGVAKWGIEGGANLISYEAVRRAAGMPLSGNYDFRNPGPGPFERYYALRAQHGSGELTDGYEGANGLLRDLVIRRVERGEGVDQAVREVSRGAAEGWFGIDRHGSRRQGLTRRMRARISGWDAPDAVLTWTLSHAADDRTDSPVYQDRASLEVWRLAANGYGWAPSGVLRGGEGAVSASRAYGSPGYFYLHDTGAGVSVRVGATVENVRWRVLRTR